MQRQCIETTQRERKGMDGIRDVLANKRPAAIRHEQAFGPAGRDISHHKIVHEGDVDIGATTVLTNINLQIARQKIVGVDR